VVAECILGGSVHEESADKGRGAAMGAGHADVNATGSARRNGVEDDIPPPTPLPLTLSV
jgi:hypothetical protein